MACGIFPDQGLKCVPCIGRWTLNHCTTREVSFYVFKSGNRDFPGSAVVKNLPANAGDMGSIPGPGISPMPRSS